MSSIAIAILDDNPDHRILIEEYCNQVKNRLNVTGTIIKFPTVEDFLAFESGFDILIADLNFSSADESNREGWRAVETILTTEIIPVIIYSAYAGDDNIENKYKNMLIKRIIKGEGDNIGILLEHFIRIKLHYNNVIENITKEYNKISLESIKTILGDLYIDDELDNDKVDFIKYIIENIAYFRLCSYLINVPPKGVNAFPPESIFIYPCLDFPGIKENSLLLGTVLKKKETEDKISLWLVASPSCDIIITEKRKQKIKQVLLLRCYRDPSHLSEFAGKEKPEIINDIKNGIKRSKYKILKCPKKLFDSEHLLISYKDYTTESFLALSRGFKSGRWQKIATLSTPYAESLQNLFIQDLGRIGTPLTIKSSDEEKWVKHFVGT